MKGTSFKPNFRIAVFLIGLNTTVINEIKVYNFYCRIPAFHLKARQGVDFLCIMGLPEFAWERNIILIPNNLVSLFLVNGSFNMSANQKISDKVALK